MKLSDLIRKLEILKEKHGDNELHFSIKDNYSVYGESATMHLKVGDEGNEFDWFGVTTRDGHTTIGLHLDEQNDKKPKITFRK